MAQIMQVLLSKGESPNLGFRLQGGKDFGTPLVIQKVNGGSPAEKAGLIAGDAVIKINNIDVFNLRHKDAQDVIIRSGPSFEITVQRGGSIWKPTIQLEGNVPSHKAQIKNVAPVTKTSLAARNQSNIGTIGTGHNVAAKPFTPQLNGSMNGAAPKMVNKQYNSPLGLYSEESIADTLSAQTEVLATGALGVNFKKNEKNFDISKSAVLSILQEAEKEPSHYETEPDSGIVRTPSQAIVGLRPVTAPETRAAPAQPQLPPGQNICANCERLIVGVFVRIKDKNLHVECFKCSTCGSSLKNVGYYNINNKLYCDVHAKLAAKNNPPAPNLVPVTIPPGTRSPTSTISASLGSHSVPPPAPLSPRTSNTSAAPFQVGSHFSSPRPFASVASPLVAPQTNINNYPGQLSTNVSSKIFAAPSLPSPSIIPSSPGGSFSAKPGVLKVPEDDDDKDTDDIIYTIDMIIPLNNQINVTVPLTHNNPASNILIEDDLYRTSDIAVSRRCASPKSAENRVTYLETDFSTPDVNIPLSDAITISITQRQSRSKFGASFSSPCVSPTTVSLQSSSPRFRNNSSDYDGALVRYHISDSLSRPLSPVVYISDKLESSDKPRRFVCSNSLEEKICCVCNYEIERGPFISALGKFWCPEHFICATPSCRRPLQDVGFVEEQGKLYCEFCFEQYLAPNCAKCNNKIKADCLRAIQKHFHPECFKCTYCSKQFGNTPFFLEDGLPYCQDDWNELFTTKCFACGFPVEAGDRWVEALNNNYHTQCFNCSMCKKNLEGQSFFAKGGRPFCKNHAR